MRVKNKFPSVIRQGIASPEGLLGTVKEYMP